jgi:glycosyltransferase involved in cell wall biosynthesis
VFEIYSSQGGGIKVPKISVIVPILNEEKYIKNLLESIIKSDFPKEEIEVLLVDGISSDETVKIIKEYQKKYPFFKLLFNPKKIVPTAMNIGIKAATGEFIIRLDAHSSYPKDYFSKLIKYHKKLDAWNVGGVCKTEVLKKTKISNAIKKVLSHPFGVGNATFRVGTKEILEVDTVPFGCYKKEIFDKIGLYDERLVRNQDIEFNKRIKANGGKIFLIPDIICTYYAREDLKSFAKNNFLNGKWNILTLYFTKRLSSLSLRHFIPLLFLLSLILPIFFAPFFKYWYILPLLSLTSYLGLVIIVALKNLDKNENFLDFFYLVVSFFTLHISYGAGSLAGIFEIFIKKLKGKEDENEE